MIYNVSNATRVLVLWQIAINVPMQQLVHLAKLVFYSLTVLVVSRMFRLFSELIFI